MPPTWTKLTIQVPPELEDPLSDFLAVLTGRGVCLYESTSGRTIEAFLSPDKREEQILRTGNLLQSLVQMNALEEGFLFEQEEVPEEDWMEVFRSQHATVRISDRLLIRPTWCESKGNREVVLDPGLAFGTGSHPTTKMCLDLLDSVIKDTPPSKMLDLGTGSGILALAGARLGIKDILAVDIDPVAVHVAKENVHANKQEGSVRVLEGGIEKAQGLYDVITANMFAALLETLAQQIVPHLAPHGCLIISGILEDEWEDVLNVFKACGLTKVNLMSEKVWIAALLVSPTGNE